MSDIHGIFLNPKDVLLIAHNLACNVSRKLLLTEVDLAIIIERDGNIVFFGL